MEGERERERERKGERLVNGNCETLNEFLFFFFSFVRVCVLTLLFYNIFIGGKV